MQFPPNKGINGSVAYQLHYQHAVGLCIENVCLSIEISLALLLTCFSVRKHREANQTPFWLYLSSFHKVISFCPKRQPIIRFSEPKQLTGVELESKPWIGPKLLQCFYLLCRRTAGNKSVKWPRTPLHCLFPPKLVYKTVCSRYCVFLPCTVVWNYAVLLCTSV